MRHCFSERLFLRLKFLFLFSSLNCQLFLFFLLSLHSHFFFCMSLRIHSPLHRIHLFRSYKAHLTRTQKPIVVKKYIMSIVSGSNYIISPPSLLSIYFLFLHSSLTSSGELPALTHIVRTCTYTHPHTQNTHRHTLVLICTCV